MSKVSATKKVTKSKVDSDMREPVVELPPSVAKVSVPVTEVPEAVSTPDMKQRFELLIKMRQDQIVSVKQEIQDLRKMQRDYEQFVKESSKRKKKVPRDNTVPRKPSGFASPQVVSDQLYKFLSQFGIKKGDPIARTEVTKHIIAYIKKHNLQNEQNRREILPDATLKSIFGELSDYADVEGRSPTAYTYLQVQRYLTKHFPKKQKA